MLSSHKVHVRYLRTCVFRLTPLDEMSMCMHMHLSGSISMTRADTYCKYEPDRCTCKIHMDVCTRADACAHTLTHDDVGASAGLMLQACRRLSVRADRALAQSRMAQQTRHTPQTYLRMHHECTGMACCCT